MSALAPLISLVLLLFITRAFGQSWRESVLAASVVWGLLLVVITEVLSVFGSLSYPTILASWLISSAILAPFVPWAALDKRFLSVKGRLAGAPLMYVLPIGFVIVLTGIIAFIAAPNNYDSMTYHLGRVVHWVQNQSVRHYPTGIDRQLYMPPWAEFAISHFYLLSGGDRLANGVQWFSMLGSLIGVSLLAKQLGGSKETQLFSALIAGCLPMGILQSSSTQTDYVVTLWLVCFVYYTLRLIEVSETQAPTLRQSGLAGACLGLAFLTKPTAYLLAFPFLGWLSFVLARRWRLSAVKIMAVICGIALAINLTHYIRNLETFGAPIAPSSPISRWTNVSLDLEFIGSQLISNVIRNTALQMATPSYSGTRIVEIAVEKLELAVRGETAGPNFRLPTHLYHEDFAGNPVHLFLIVLCGVALIGRLKQRGLSLIHYYVSSLVVGYLALCFCLQWNPWVARFHLPLLVLWAAAIANTLNATVLAPIRTVIIVLLIVASQPALFFNETRALIGISPVLQSILQARVSQSILQAPRAEQYFRGRPDLLAPYTEAATVIKDKRCTEIALWAEGGNVYEYPLWILLNSARADQVRIEHIRSSNESAGTRETNRFVPCILFSVTNTDTPNTVTEAGRTYAKIWSDATSISTSEDPKAPKKFTAMAVHILESGVIPPG